MEKLVFTTDIHLVDGPQDDSTRNRRKWARYAMPAEDVVLNVQQSKRRAVIVDESIGGLGIKVDNIRKLKPGQQVSLCFRGLTIMAEIKSVSEDDDGLYHVGIGWLDTGLNLGPAAPPPRKDTAQFICHRGVWLVCDLLEQTEDGTAIIVLWDNSYFEVDAWRIVEKTVAQRNDELQALGEDITLLAALYRLGDQGTMEKSCEAILNYEFAIHWID
ncbi:MAG: hypothetical protein GTO53_00325 [Planctomycetales bacterium]|nr:hypothetical protein [Planctomycetales bacterium]NIM07626.1 hypothetical protein [Planctomycetales bacterium]NIN07132.1 hypothetical protein [Planctomycetales bacterium]NIN76226.1 hypothetical protein [Planctomycetales bacterium]NIO33448.1 hypothetical protein [Planctomycetales bacterium]